MTRYTIGRAFEYRVKHDLEKKGYYVIRSAGSHSKVDLVAIYKSAILFIQCKTSGRLKNEDRDFLFDLAHEAIASAVLAENCNGKIRYQLLGGMGLDGYRWEDFEPSKWSQEPPFETSSS